jgi:hypothetical protein
MIRTRRAALAQSGYRFSEKIMLKRRRFERLLLRPILDCRILAGSNGSAAPPIDDGRRGDALEHDER